MKRLTRIALLSFLAVGVAHAQEGNENPPPGAAPAPAAAPGAPPPTAQPAAPAAEVVTTVPAPEHDRGAFIIGLKAGGTFSDAFSKLGPSFLVDLELGYVLPYAHRGFAILIDGGYTMPTLSGSPNDPRVDANSGNYNWDLTQHEIVLGLTLMYRIHIGSGRFAPYIGAGPRMWLLYTQVQGSAGSGNNITQSTENSIKAGLGVPIGVDMAAGPGRVFVEAQLFWAPIDHLTTGEASVGAITAELGYRLWL